MFFILLIYLFFLTCFFLIPHSPLSSASQLASGYDGYEDMYFSSRELEAAYEAEGLALDFWTGYQAVMSLYPFSKSICFS